MIDADLFYQRLRPFLGWAALTLTEFSIGIAIAFRAAFQQQNGKRLPLVVWLSMAIMDRINPGNHSPSKNRLQGLWKHSRTALLI